MRKKLFITLSLSLILALCCSCEEKKESNEGGFMNITEKLFVQQMNELYINSQDYLGFTIKYEGIFSSYIPDQESAPDVVYYVFRYGPGCCSYDANVGFQIEYDGEYPEENSWVEISGVLKEREIDGETYLYLDADELTVMDTRGAETVSN